MRIRVLPKEFSANVDGLGIHRFKAVDWKGDIRLYERYNSKGRLIGYEVFVVQVNGPDTYGPKRESYPSARSFGRTAWFCTSMERAAERFNNLAETPNP